MDEQSLILAKVAALKKSFENVNYEQGRCLGNNITHLFLLYEKVIQGLKKLNSNVFLDIPDLKIPEPLSASPQGYIYEKNAIAPLVTNLEYILELNSNLRIGERVLDREKSRKIFISHGRSSEWYKIQSYLERDLNFRTLELAQEPNLGRTVLQKLAEESEKCSVAVILMTGDDELPNGELRTRENVMHEIGYFQGKFGFGNVILLHEQSVNIPSNIHGLVYISFPKDGVESTLGALQRELKVLFS